MWKINLLIFWSLILAFPFQLFADGKDCLISPSELGDLLKLDYKAFDQTLPDGGWRGLSNRGCDLEATKVVEIYHLHHYDELTPGQTRILYWHAGQVYAMQGLNDLALARFKKSFYSNEKPDEIKWNSYVRGSIAFLEHDMKKLVAARDELKAVDKTQSDPNLKLLEAFVRCFNKTYKEAYNPACK